MNEPGVQQNDNQAEAMIRHNTSMEKYGKCFRNFHHGVIHGIIAAFFSSFLRREPMPCS
jgi:hypothetical protein